MNKALKIIVVVVLVFVVLLVAAPFLIPVNQFKPTIEQKASEVLGRKVQLGDLSLSLFSGSVSAESLSIGDDPKFSSAPFLTAKSLKVGVEILPLILSKTLNVQGVTITSPEVILLHNASGTWNYSTLGGTAAKHDAKPAAPKSSGAGAAADISISKLNLTDGTIIVGEANSQKRSTYNHLNVTASDVSITSKFPVKVTADLPGGGKFDVEGTVGPVDQTDTSLTPLESKLKISSMNLGSTGLLDPSMGLGGILDLDSNLSSQGGIAQVKGTVKLSKAQLVAGGSPAGVPVTVNMDTKYNLRKNTGVLEPSTLNIGSAVAHLGGTYETAGESTSVNMKMDAKDMPAKDLEAFLPAVGVHLPTGASLTAGTVNANLNITGPTNKLVIAGNIGMFNGVLAGFDLGSKMAAVASMAGIKSMKDMKIEKLTSNVKVAPAGIRADDFDSVVDGIGELTGAGTLDAKNELDFKMIAALSTQAGSASSGGSGGCGGGGLKVPFQVQGTTANPKIMPDVGGLAEGLFKSKLGCAGGLAGLGGKATDQNPADAINALGGLFKKKKP